MAPLRPADRPDYLWIMLTAKPTGLAGLLVGLGGLLVGLVGLHDGLLDMPTPIAFPPHFETRRTMSALPRFTSSRALESLLL